MTPFQSETRRVTVQLTPGVPCTYTVREINAEDLSHCGAEYGRIVDALSGALIAGMLGGDPGAVMSVFLRVAGDYVACLRRVCTQDREDARRAPVGSLPPAALPPLIAAFNELNVEKKQDGLDAIVGAFRAPLERLTNELRRASAARGSDADSPSASTSSSGTATPSSTRCESPSRASTRRATSRDEEGPGPAPSG